VEERRLLFDQYRGFCIFENEGMNEEVGTGDEVELENRVNASRSRLLSPFSPSQMHAVYF
jgi:hypothetical protein